MSFYTSLTGLNAATAQLGVTSNNIANVRTTGFKRSRTDFGDIELLKASIERYGIIQPLIIDHNNVLIDGGRRLRAAGVSVDAGQGEITADREL